MRMRGRGLQLRSDGIWALPVGKLPTRMAGDKPPLFRADDKSASPTGSS